MAWSDAARRAAAEARRQNARNPMGRIKKIQGRLREIYLPGPRSRMPSDREFGRAYSSILATSRAMGIPKSKTMKIFGMSKRALRSAR